MESKLEKSAVYYLFVFKIKVSLGCVHTMDYCFLQISHSYGENAKYVWGILLVKNQNRNMQ